MKDFYDIWLLIQQFQFDRNNLNTIILQVLKNRETIIRELPEAFSEVFYNDLIKFSQWKSFLKDISHEEIPLKTVVCNLRDFFKEVLTQK